MAAQPPNSGPLQQPELKNQLEVTARIGGILLIAVYVAGYLVITFSDASRGIVNFGFFRAKVLASGILFLVFLILPLLDWSRIFGAFQSPGYGERAIKEAVVPEARARFYFTAIKLLLFFMGSLGLAFLLSLFLFRDVTGRFFGFYLVFVAISAALLLYCGPHFPKHPLRCAILCWGLTAVGVALVIFIGNRQVQILMGWFLLVGEVAHFLKKEKREAAHWADISWHWVLIRALTVFWFFAALMYQKVPPSLGGGQPARTTFQFVNLSPIDNASKDNLWLLDETETGYYVLKLPDDRKAVFLPRGSVAAIYFESQQPFSQSH